MIFSPVRLLLVIAATPARKRKSGSSKSEAKLPGATAPTPAIVCCSVNTASPSSESAAERRNTVLSPPSSALTMPSELPMRQ